VAPGRKTLRKIQWGIESTPGTAVAATAIWRGKGDTISDDREVTEVEEMVGIIGGTDRTLIARIFATLALSETEATYQQLPYLFAMLFGGVVTGVADGSGSTGFKYLTTIPTTSAPTGKFYTIETGDDFEAEEMEYTHAVKVTLSGVAGKALMVSAELQGRQATKTTFTGALSVVAVEDILTSMGTLALDAIGGTAGATVISNQLLSFKIDFEALWAPKDTIDGHLYFSFPQFTGQKISGELTFEHDTIVSGNAQNKAKWRAQTPQLMRLDFPGSSYATPGTGTSFTGGKSGLRVDLPIKWTKFAALSDQDGNDTVVATFSSRYNSTAATAGSVLITNEVSALP
jgi:hypothetical protein